MSTILVIADQDKQPPTAIERACDLANTYEARLHVVYFCYANLRELGDKGDESKQALMARQQQRAASELADLPCGHSHEVVWAKNIPEWVNQYISQSAPVLIVKTSHRSETLTYTPTDWHLMRQAKAPVFLVATKKWHKASTVMATVDFGTRVDDKMGLNRAVMDKAHHLAKHYGVDMHICYAPPFSEVLRDLGFKTDDDVTRETYEKLRSEIAALATHYHIPESHIHIHAGDPEKVIPSVAAKCKAGLVVVGTVGRRGLSGMLIGNTAERILALLKTDVLTLKP